MHSSSSFRPLVRIGLAVLTLFSLSHSPLTVTATYWEKQQGAGGNAAAATQPQAPSMMPHGGATEGVSPSSATGGGAHETIDLSKPLQWESTEKGTIDLNGKPFHIKGINWNGMELPPGMDSTPMISGLEHRKMGDLLDFLAERNFNALRIPLSYEVITHIDDPQYRANEINYADPELRGKGLFQVMDTFVEEAGKRGILVMFDMHQIDPKHGFDPLWYTEKVSEADVNKALSKVVGRYKKFWNFFAIDIKNEPHGDASWGDQSPATDFNKYAERTMVMLNREHPDFKGLYVVNGVSDHVDVDQSFKSPWKHWWGGRYLFSVFIATHTLGALKSFST